MRCLSLVLYIAVTVDKTQARIHLRLLAAPPPRTRSRLRGGRVEGGGEGLWRRNEGWGQVGHETVPRGKAGPGWRAGSWRRGARNGAGTFTYKSGQWQAGKFRPDVYVGERVDDVKEGQGSGGGGGRQGGAR